MIPIHHLLSRIRWDPDFGRGEFVLGYYDRILEEVVRVFSFRNHQEVTNNLPCHSSFSRLEALPSPPEIYLSS